MKEKIKNFLLKIKNSLCTEIKTPVYKILLFGLIMIVLSCISFSCANFVIDTLNDMQTEQVEEIPQTESMRIDRDINMYGYTYDNNITFGGTPIIGDSPFSNFYFNTALKDGYVEERLSTLIDYMVYIEEESMYLYPVFSLTNSSNDNSLNCNIIFMEYPYENDTFLNVGLIIFVDNFGVQYLVYTSHPEIDGLDIPPGFGISQVTPSLGNIYDFIIEYNLDYIANAGLYNEHFSWLVSRTPFTISSNGSSTPQLENAPIDLVEDYPLEAYPDIPSYIGHQVYNSGSGSTIYSDNSELDTFGFKLFYDTETSFVNQEHYFILDGNTFYTYEPIYKFTIKKITLVITTIWSTHQIYYAFDLLETPIDFYADMGGVIGGYFHEIAIQPIIEERYSDYIHINYDFIYNMGYIRNGERVYLSSVTEYGYGALIPSNTLESNYGEKGFILDTVPQLDTGYQLIALNQMVGYNNNIIYDTMPDVYVKGQEKGENIGYSTGS